jgi:hypothetical protein
MTPLITCTVCTKVYDLSEIGLEQKLIEDKELCQDCWNECMLYYGFVEDLDEELSNLN